MTNEALMDQHTQRIIKRYTQVYTLFFRYSMFFIPLALGLILALFLQSRTHIVHNSGAIRMQENKSFSEINGIYRAERISDQVGSVLSGAGEIDILAGELQVSAGVIIGRNNLIKLNNIILPSNTYIVNTEFSGDLSTFEKPYSTSELKWILENWLLSSMPDGSGVDTTRVNSIFLKSENPIDSSKTNMEVILATLQKRLYFAQLQQSETDADKFNMDAGVTASTANEQKLISDQNI